MLRITFCLTLLSILFSCKPQQELVEVSDITHFWETFDAIQQENDSTRHLEILQKNYLDKGTPGLESMRRAKNYTPTDYVEMIANYPNFLKSLRSNTLNASSLSGELEEGIEKFRAIYPDLKPAKIYFTIGAMRSGGTALDGHVLIGSEFAMMDSTTDISEFKGDFKNWAEGYAATDPLGNIVLLNIHEYVHTQQQSIPDNLLYQCLYEGVAEFVSTKAMEVPSSSPAIAYGKSNDAVRNLFEEEMFYERTYEWLWSNAPNDFDVRDLGYYIGYALCESYYINQTDKEAAIKTLIELDFTQSAAIDSFIDQIGFFSKTIAQLRTEDTAKRPYVTKVQSASGALEKIAPGVQEIQVQFSQALNNQFRGLNYSDLWEDGFPEIQNSSWSEDNMTWTMEVVLEPNHTYKFWLTGGFQTESGIPIQHYLVEFTTHD